MKAAPSLTRRPQRPVLAQKPLVFPPATACAVAEVHLVIAGGELSPPARPRMLPVISWDRRAGPPPDGSLTGADPSARRSRGGLPASRAAGELRPHGQRQ